MYKKINISIVLFNHDLLFAFLKLFIIICAKYNETISKIENVFNFDGIEHFHMFLKSQFNLQKYLSLYKLEHILKYATIIEKR